VRDDVDAGVLAGFVLNAWEGAVLGAKVDKNGAALQQFRAVVFPLLARR